MLPPFSGSLYDYLLTHRPLTSDVILQILTSIATGLNYLHTEINGSDGWRKTLVAHRDIKVLFFSFFCNCALTPC